MKRYLSLFFFVVFMVAVTVFPLSAVGADRKIGVVDLQRCLTESIEGKRVFQDLKTKKDGMQRKLDERQEELLKLKDELEKQSMMLSMDAKEDKEKEFERKRRDFKYFYDDLSSEMKKAEAEARAKMLKELEKVVVDIGEKGLYLMVFERRSGGIMYIDKAIDITVEVIKAYDKTKR